MKAEYNFLRVSGKLKTSPVTTSQRNAEFEVCKRLFRILERLVNKGLEITTKKIPIDNRRLQT